MGATIIVSLASLSTRLDSRDTHGEVRTHTHTHQLTTSIKVKIERRNLLHILQWTPPLPPRLPSPHANWLKRSRVGACCMCWLKCHTIYYTFGMTNARRTHIAVAKAVQRSPRRAWERNWAWGLPLKLVKNCSNFPLVKQMSQGNMPPAIATSIAACTPPPPNALVIVAAVVVVLQTFATTHFDHCQPADSTRCQYFVNLRRLEKKIESRRAELYRRTDTSSLLLNISRSGKELNKKP